MNGVLNIPLRSRKCLFNKLSKKYAVHCPLVATKKQLFLQSTTVVHSVKYYNVIVLTRSKNPIQEHYPPKGGWCIFKGGIIMILCILYTGIHNIGQYRGSM